jgi:carbonic anhydrase
MHRRTAVTRILACSAALLLRSRTAEETHHWAYEGLKGPGNWSKEFPGCAGRSQSPIDIRAEKVSGHPIDFHYEDTPLRVNNGPRPGLTKTPHAQEPRQAFRGSPSADYDRTASLLAVHFHHGRDDRER